MSNMAKLIAQQTESNLTEAEAIRQAKDGVAAAFEYLYKAHCRRVGRKSGQHQNRPKRHRYATPSVLHSNNLGLRIPGFRFGADSGPSAQMVLLLGGARYSEIQNCSLFCLVFSIRISACRC